MSKPVLIFRTDAGSKMGTGHLMRSASLAGLLSEQFTTKLITTCTIPQLIDSVWDNFSSVFLLNESTDESLLFNQEAGDQKLAVLDGYHFDKVYQQKLQQSGFRLTVIDDLITEPISADLVINHCGGLKPFHYQSTPQTVFALGTGYLLLNPVFQLSSQERRKSVTDTNCFVCLGGADPQNDTVQVVKKLVEAAQFDNIQIVTGAAYQHKEVLADYCTGKKKLHWHQGISAKEMKALMQQCSFAVCSPSTIVHEYLSVGGVVWLKQIADNQKHILQFMIKEGLAFNLDKDTINTADSFDQMFAQQSLYFDGGTAQRLQKLFQSWTTATASNIRRAGKDDLMTCYYWVNDAEVRAQSYASEPIPLVNHTAWFTKKINDPSCFYYILLQGETPVAQIRFDVSGNDATISYLTDPSWRGKGMGPWILAKGIKALTAETSIKKIVGHVKANNIASLRSFEKLAFEKQESSAFPDSFTYTMILHGN
ncbi:UDP-2,4-diacetamido-2,4,6-trideoxy-beta-L-altropyranose hydrolase [Flavisolibacter sp. BT320]|nr:UDP-2,4-diacetamido-2,4,6-trideoxy-beta-L-altropyranose hydrolase [Flavisolibacter longurius]